MRDRIVIDRSKYTPEEFRDKVAKTKETLLKDAATLDLVAFKINNKGSHNSLFADYDILQRIPDIIFTLTNFKYSPVEESFINHFEDKGDFLSLTIVVKQKKNITLGGLREHLSKYSLTIEPYDSVVKRNLTNDFVIMSHIDNQEITLTLGFVIAKDADEYMVDAGKRSYADWYLIPRKRVTGTFKPEEKAVLTLNKYVHNLETINDEIF